MITMQLRPANTLDEALIENGSVFYRAHGHLFEAWTVGEYQTKPETRRDGTVISATHFSLTNATGAYTGRSTHHEQGLLHDLHVAAAPDDPDAFDASVLDVDRTYLILRVEHDSLDTDTALTSALSVLAEHGFRPRRGSIAVSDTDKRENVYLTSYTNGERQDKVVGVNIPHRDVSYVAQEAGANGSYGTVASSPEIVVG